MVTVSDYKFVQVDISKGFREPSAEYPSEVIKHDSMSSFQALATIKPLLRLELVASGASGAPSPSWTRGCCSGCGLSHSRNGYDIRGGYPHIETERKRHLANS